jgi:GGDEF domain-containing protein
MERPFGVDGHGVAVGASIGVAQHPPLPGDALGLIMQADRAMYEAKHAGKGCVRYAAP